MGLAFRLGFNFLQLLLLTSSNSIRSVVNIFLWKYLSDSETQTGNTLFLEGLNFPTSVDVEYSRWMYFSAVHSWWLERVCILGWASIPDLILAGGHQLPIGSLGPVSSASPSPCTTTTSTGGKNPFLAEEELAMSCCASCTDKRCWLHNLFCILVCFHILVLSVLDFLIL